MSEIDVDDLLARGLVAAYWANYRQDDTREQRIAGTGNFWAWDAVTDLVRVHHARSVDVIELLAHHVSGDLGALAHLGAGPIEDLLRHCGPPRPELVAALDAAARRSPDVAHAVRCVWWSDDDDPALVTRFTRFGPPR